MKNTVVSCSDVLNLLRKVCIQPIVPFNISFALYPYLSATTHLLMGGWFMFCLLLLIVPWGLRLVSTILDRVSPFQCALSSKLILYCFVMSELASHWGMQLVTKAHGCMLAFRPSSFTMTHETKCMLFVLCLPVASAVCSSCHGMAAQFGCKGTNPEACPFATGTVQNTKAIAATAATATAAVITVAKLLPMWVSRLFSRDKLAVVMALARRSAAGSTTFDPEGASRTELMTAVKTGRLSRDDAVFHCESKAEDIDLESFGKDDKDAYDMAKDKRDSWLKLSETLQKLTVLTESRLEDESNTSAPLFNLALLSERVCTTASKKDKFDLNVCGDTEEDSGTSKAKSLSATLKRPSNEQQFHRLLNMWVLVNHATSVCSCLVLLAFLDEVVHKPIAEEQYNWAVAFEVLVHYLLEVEASNGTFTIGTIRTDMGGLDMVRASAIAKAKEFHGAGIFRAHGGNPGYEALRLQDPKNRRAEKDIKGNPNSKKGCACWNMGTRHSDSHLGQDGHCKFSHACDRFLKTKNADGSRKQCLGSGGTPGHKRGECDHPDKAEQQ